ncbi:MAG: peptidoglycan DD-metalloendopeptidase family protein [Bacteroidales bacterium]|jgi:septal ring factor EnvC (AmiA/AmiB activator)|nr:peptidoglycan DD-metalloendopeptidase family protein [Bacteroidales bacterium]
MRRIYCFLSLLILSFAALEAQQSIEDIRQERLAVLERIKAANESLSANQKSSKALLYQYTILNDQIKSTEQYISRLNTEMNKLSRSLRNLQNEYNELKRQLSVKQQQYAQLIRQLHTRLKTDDRLMFIFSAENLSQSYRRIRYMNEYTKFQRRQAEEIRQKQEQLEKKRIDLELAYQQQKELLAEHQAERDRLSKEKENKHSLLNTLKKKESSLNAELKKDRELAARLDKRIEEIIAEETRKASQDKERSEPESKGGYAMTIDEKKLSADFGSNKGKLPFPLNEPGTIIVHFGQQKFQELKYVQTNSKGIDIQTRAGASARAVFKGTVSKIFMVPGMNASVIVRHGKYLSVYSNLEDVRVKLGDQVKTGELLGKVFVDKQQANQTILHFQIWEDTQRLNPELWIKKF